FDGYVFEVDEFTVTFDPIGGDPLNFTYGEELDVQFTPYVFEFEADPGFVATIGSPDFLAFLDPTLTVAYSGQDSDGDDQLDFFKSGIRLTMSPFEGFTVGASYGRAAENAADFNDVNGDNVLSSVFGVDGSLSLSIFDLGFEYASGTDPNATPTSESLLYVTLDVDTAGLPLLTSLSANYRDIPSVWVDDDDDTATPPTVNYGLMEEAADADYPFDEDQTGFKVSAGLGLFILDLDAYFDSYATTGPDQNTSAFGVDVEADLFAGFALTGFYHQVSVDGTVVDSTAAAGTERDNNNYDTGYGVGLVHDGAAENALISGLDLGFEYRQMEADFDQTELEATAEMDFDIAILSLTPYVAYESVNDADTGSDDTNTIRVGTGLSTDPLGVFFAPSLEAAVNYRSTNHSDAAVYTATEMQWSVGLVLNEFLFDNSTFTAKYGSWTGTNVADDAGVDVGEGATNISAGDDATTGTQSVSGYELVWNYFDLEMAYGVYTADEADAAGSSAGQVFSISYSVDF
ncbi:MAG TPA: hypothetical protein VF168_02835, partial [Trueperaceae bacterium]